MPESNASWSVAVFAHNESRHILHCLDSLLVNQSPVHPLVIHVLANGCTDDTEDLVADYARTRPFVHLHPIELGDKANAWNTYLHQIAPHSDVHYFIDGDVEACHGALIALSNSLIRHPHANAAAALPISGRSVTATRRAMLENADLAGNLYALNGNFVQRLRERNIIIPVGFVGEDSLVGAFAKWNLEPENGWDDARIVPCPAAGFYFETLSWRDVGHWRLYWNRRIRYSMRKFQLQSFRAIVKRNGLENIPAHVREMYGGLPTLRRLEWRWPDAIFDFFAIRRIRRISRIRKQSLKKLTS